MSRAPVEGEIDSRSSRAPPGDRLFTMLTPPVGGMPLEVAKDSSRPAAGIGCAALSPAAAVAA